MFRDSEAASLFDALLKQFCILVRLGCRFFRSTPPHREAPTPTVSPVFKKRSASTAQRALHTAPRGARARSSQRDATPASSGGSAGYGAGSPVIRDNKCAAN